MDPWNLRSEARALEDVFFARENSRLLEQLRQESRRKLQREELCRVLKVSDEALLNHLIELGLDCASGLALTLVPLAAVAWADGDMDPREREAILSAAADKGLEPDSAGRRLLESWLSTRPESRLLDVWKRYARHLWESLQESEKAEMHRLLIEETRAIAEAAGGILRLTSKISAAERAMIEELSAIFR